MHLYVRPVRFEEVDAAGILFFPRFLGYAHEAMESFFAELDGGYPRLILERGVGLPAVDVKSRYAAPVRYGDTVRIETVTSRLGGRSAVLSYRVLRERDGVLAAEIDHTVVTTALAEMKSVEMPADVRAVFERHLVREGA